MVLDLLLYNDFIQVEEVGDYVLLEYVSLNQISFKQSSHYFSLESHHVTISVLNHIISLFIQDNQLSSAVGINIKELQKICGRLKLHGMIKVESVITLFS